VSKPEHTRKSPAVKTGPFATLCALFRGQGSGAPSYIRLRLALAPLAAFSATAGFGLGGLALTAAPATAAEPCPNEAIRAQQPYASALPDCRAYEQVSPVNKDGAEPSGDPSLVQASPAGDRLTFLVNSGYPNNQGVDDFALQLSARSASGWSTQGLLAPTPPGASSSDVRGWSADLTKVIDTAGAPADDSNLGLTELDSATGVFTPMLTGTGDFADTYAFDGASADGSRVVFEDLGGLLTPDASAGNDNVYEWRASSGVQLIGRVPASGTSCNDASGPACVTPSGGSMAGPYGWMSDHLTYGGGVAGYYTQSAVSSDGSRVFFTAGGTGQLYVRENGTSTVQVSASQGTTPDPNGTEPATFMAATPDGSHVFFLSCEKLTDDSTAVSTGSNNCREGFATPSQGQDLYDYDVGTGTLSDLTVDTNASDTLGAGVQGVLGESDDGSYVYFLANGVLAPGASPGSCNGVERSGVCNLYVSHNGTVTFIAQLAPGRHIDTWDFVGALCCGGKLRERTARVSADGSVLLFASARKLTAYDNAGLAEFYRYDATDGHLNCVSCDPAGAPPTAAATLQSIETSATPPFPAAVLTHSLSADGSRVFFESSDALLPAAANGLQNVYEWEADGAGGCQSSADNGGCLYLISTGQSRDPSYFADASASGGDVFFFTSQQLVGEDQDHIVDIYDARVGGGFPAPPALRPVCEGEVCRGAPAAPPVFGAPASATFSGAGNFPPVPVATPRPLTGAQKLAKALKACRKDKKHSKRRACERSARKKYSFRASKSSGIR
jgi:hypothetical protein